MKLNLIPTYQLAESLKSNHFATYTPKSGSLRLSSDYVRDKNLAGKWLRTFADAENKVIAWTLAESGDISKLRGLAQVKTYNDGKTFQISLPKGDIGKALRIDIERSYKRLEIRTQARAMFGASADFVIIVPNKNKSNE